MLRVGIADISGIVNIANIADVADIGTDIADIADRMLRTLRWKQVDAYKVSWGCPVTVTWNLYFLILYCKPAFCRHLRTI